MFASFSGRSTHLEKDILSCEDGKHLEEEDKKMFDVFHKHASY
jgi:hypothetical protein